MRPGAAAPRPTQSGRRQRCQEAPGTRPRRPGRRGRL